MMQNLRSNSSLPYLLAAHGRKQAEFVANNLPRAYPAQIIEVQTDPQKRKSNNMVTVSLRVDSGKDSNLPNLEVPVATSRYLRLPLQVGDWGVLIPSNYSIQTLIGAPGVVPNIHYPVADLCSLIFMPVSRFPKNAHDPEDKMVWAEADPDTLILSGERNGVEIINQIRSKTDMPAPQAMIQIKNNGIMLKFGLADNPEAPFAEIKEDGITLSIGSVTAKLSRAGFNISGKSITQSDQKIGGNCKIVGNLEIDGNLTINGTPFLDHKHSNGNMGSPTGSVIP